MERVPDPRHAVGARALFDDILRHLFPEATSFRGARASGASGGQLGPQAVDNGRNCVPVEAAARKPLTQTAGEDRLVQSAELHGAFARGPISVVLGGAFEEGGGIVRPRA